MDTATFTAATELIGRAHWTLNFPAFCARAGFREDSYAEEKWSQWQSLASALRQFNPRQLAQICGITEPVSDSTDATEPTR